MNGSYYTTTEREAKGNRLVYEGKVSRTDWPGRYYVKSSTSDGGYMVDLKARRCDCPDNRHSGNVCKHILAAETFQRLAAEREAEHGKAEALRQRVNARITTNQAAW